MANLLLCAIGCVMLLTSARAQCRWNLEPLRLNQVQQCFSDGGAYNSTRAQLEVDVVRHAMDHYAYLDLIRNSGPPWEYRLNTLQSLRNISADAARTPAAFPDDWSFYETLSKPLRAMGDSHVALLKPQCYAIIGAQPVTPAPFYLNRQDPSQVRYFLSELTLGQLDLARTYDPGAVAFLPAREVSRSVLQLYEVLAIDGLAPAEYVASTINNPEITSPYSHDPAVSFTAALRNLQVSLRLMQLDALPETRTVSYTLRRCEAPMSGNDVASADMTQLTCAADVESNEVTLTAEWLFFHTATSRPTTSTQFSRLCARQTAVPQVRVGSDCRAAGVARGVGSLARAASFVSESARGALLRSSILADSKASMTGTSHASSQKIPVQGERNDAAAERMLREQATASAGAVSGYRSAMKHLLGVVARRQTKVASQRRRASARDRSLFSVDALRRLDDSEPQWLRATKAGESPAGGAGSTTSDVRSMRAWTPSTAALDDLRDRDVDRALQMSGLPMGTPLADVSTVTRLQAAQSTDEQSIFQVVRTVFNPSHTEELRAVVGRRQNIIADPNSTNVPTAELIITARNYTYTSIILKIPSFSPSVLTSCFAGVDVTCGSAVSLSNLDSCISSAATTFLRRGAAAAYAAARANNASQILVDVTGNDGGVVLLGRLAAAALSAQVTNVPSLAEYTNDMRPGTAVAAMARFVDQRNGVGSARRLVSTLGIKGNNPSSTDKQPSPREQGSPREQTGGGDIASDIWAEEGLIIGELSRRSQGTRSEVGSQGTRRMQVLSDGGFPSFPLWGLLDPLDTSVLATNPDASIAVDDVDGGFGWFYESGDDRRWGGERYPVTKGVKLFDLTAEMAKLPADVFPRGPGELVSPIPLIIASDGMCGSTCAQFLRSLVDTGAASVIGLVASAGTAYPTGVTDSFAGGFIVQDADSQLVLPYKEAQQLGLADPATFSNGDEFRAPQFMPSSANVAYNFGSARSKRRPTYPLQFDPQRADAYTVDQSLNIAQPPSDLEFAAYLASEAGLRLPYTSNPSIASATLVEAGTTNALLSRAVDTAALDEVVEDEVQRRANATLLVLLAAVGDSVSRRDYNILLYICIALAVVALIALLLALILICCLGGGEPDSKDVTVEQNHSTLTRTNSKRTVTVRRRTIRNLKSDANIAVEDADATAATSAGGSGSGEHRSLHTRSFRVVTAKGKRRTKDGRGSEEIGGKSSRLRGVGSTMDSSNESDVQAFDEELDLGSGSRGRGRGRKGAGSGGNGERGDASNGMEIEPERDDSDISGGRGRGEGQREGEGGVSVEPSPRRNRFGERAGGQIEAIREEDEEDDDEDDDDKTRSRSHVASSGQILGQFSFHGAMDRQEQRRERIGSRDSGDESGGSHGRGRGRPGRGSGDFGPLDSPASERDYMGKDQVSEDVERHIFRHRYEADANGQRQGQGAAVGRNVAVMQAWGSPGMHTGGSQYHGIRAAVGSFRYGYGRPRATSPPKAVAATTKPQWESQDSETDSDAGPLTVIATGDASTVDSPAGAGHEPFSPSPSGSATTSSRLVSKRSMAQKRSQRVMVRGRSSRMRMDPLADPDHERSGAPLRQRPSMMDVRGRQASLRNAVSSQEQSTMSEMMEQQRALQRQAVGLALVKEAEAEAGGGAEVEAEAGGGAGSGVQTAASTATPRSPTGRPPLTIDEDLDEEDEAEPEAVDEDGVSASSALHDGAIPRAGGGASTSSPSPSTPRVRVTIGELMNAGN